MPVNTNDINQIRVGVLGISVDESQGGSTTASQDGRWISTGAVGSRNTLNTPERIITRVINELDIKMSGAQDVTEEFDQRFNDVVGNEAGADQVEFDAIGTNLIQAVHDLIEGGGGGGGSFTDTFSGTSWTVPHNLNQKYVLVQVVNDSGNTVIPDVDYTSDTACTLTFAKSVSGTVRIRK